MSKESAPQGRHPTISEVNGIVCAEYQILGGATNRAYALSRRTILGM
jgi:hypothetical protein